MSYVIDPVAKRIILDSTNVTVASIYVAWVNWHAIGDNSKYLFAFRTVGGDSLGGSLSIPPYYFLTNGWKIRPMEANHTLTITGNLFVDGVGDPIVPTLGAFNVLIRSVVPVQAQGISTAGSTGASASEIAAEVIAVANTTPIHCDAPTSDQNAIAVWSKPVSGMTDKTTVGGYISRVLLSVPKFLGLK